jgi:DNA anti-recombination protein RmuC
MIWLVFGGQLLLLLAVVVAARRLRTDLAVAHQQLAMDVLAHLTVTRREQAEQAAARVTEREQFLAQVQDRLEARLRDVAETSGRTLLKTRLEQRTR